MGDRVQSQCHSEQNKTRQEVLDEHGQPVAIFCGICKAFFNLYALAKLSKIHWGIEHVKLAVSWASTLEKAWGIIHMHDLPLFQQAFEVKPSIYF